MKINRIIFVFFFLLCVLPFLFAGGDQEDPPEDPGELVFTSGTETESYTSTHTKKISLFNYAKASVSQTLYAYWTGQKWSNTNVVETCDITGASQENSRSLNKD